MLIKDINFFERYNEAERREKTVSKEQAIAVIAIAIIVFGTLISTVTLNILKMTLKDELRSIEAELNSPTVIEQMAETTKKQAILDNMTHYYNAVEMASSKIMTLIKPDQQLINSFATILPADMRITSFNYSEGEVFLKCSSTMQESIATYIEKLKLLEHVYHVSYSGFTKGESQSYTCSIGITLMPGGISYE